MPACRFEREVWRMLTMMFIPFWYNILAVKLFVSWQCCYYYFQQIMLLKFFSSPGCKAFCVSEVRLIMITVNPFSGRGYDAYSVSDVRLLTMVLPSVSGPGYDAFFVSDVQLLSMVLWSVSGQDVPAGCTTHELNMLFTCITPYNPQFFAAFAGSSSVCDRSRISSDLCQ